MHQSGNPITQNLTLATVNSRVKSRFHLYGLLSQIYQLPAFDSKAITSNYLKAYIVTPCPIFRIKRTNYHPPFIVSKHVTAGEILETIEKILRAKGLPPTGLDNDKVPDVEWLIGVYFHLCPKDDHKLFPKSIKPEAEITVAVDPEIATLFENEQPKTRGRNIFKLSDKQKLDFAKQRLDTKLQKQKTAKRDLENKINSLSKKIDKTNLVYKKIIEPRNPSVSVEENKQSPILPNLFERNNIQQRTHSRLDKFDIIKMDLEADKGNLAPVEKIKKPAGGTV